MADVIGPNNKLPGQTLGFVPDGRSCDQCNTPARHAVIGESDSFGSEVHHLCSEHFLEMQKAIQEQREEPTHCEICHTKSTGCSPFRDPEEGSCGPVYNTCPACRQRITSNFIGEDAEDFNSSDLDFDDFETDLNYDEDYD